MSRTMFFDSSRLDLWQSEEATLLYKRGCFDIAIQQRFGFALVHCKEVWEGQRSKSRMEAVLRSKENLSPADWPAIMYLLHRL